MRWLKILLLSSPLFICALGLFGLSKNASAVTTWVNNPSFTYWELYANSDHPNNIFRYDNTASPPFVVLNKPGEATNLFIGLTVDGIDVSGYTYDSFTTFYLDFQLRVSDGGRLYNYSYFPNVPPHTSFVVDTISSPCDLDSASNQVYYQYHCAVSLPENYVPRALYLDIGEPYSTGAPYSPVAQINHFDTTGTVVRLNYLGYGFDTQESATNQYLDILSKQNETIINQNQTIINQMEATNDWLTDTTAPSADTSSLGNSAGWLPPGPLDSILNLPIQFIQGIVGVFTNTNTCAPIVLPLGIINYNLEIPCMRPFFELASVNIVWNTVGTIISAVLIFHTLKWLYKFVDDTLSFRESNSSMWGGL